MNGYHRVFWEVFCTIINHLLFLKYKFVSREVGFEISSSSNQATISGCGYSLGNLSGPNSHK
jgi:hypothetical protein